MHHPKSTWNATLESSKSRAVAEEHKSSIDFFSFIKHVCQMAEQDKIIFPPLPTTYASTMQGKKEINKKKSLSGSSDDRLSTVDGSKPTATKMEQSSTNGSLTETKTKTKDTVRVRSNVAHLILYNFWGQQKRTSKPLPLKMDT